ncbi:MAG: radical SAM protein [Desulfofustis sp.]|nr:radical SAM protein [Desulfofustis sp.]
MTSYIKPDTTMIPELGRFREGGSRPMMAMLEITNRCNMSCPVCFTDAYRKGPDLAFEEIERRLDKLLEIAGPIPLQISGGEPTLHPQLGDIIALARSRGFRNIELVTNGIVISTAQDYLDELVCRGLTAVYLQFDGLSEQTYKTIRGQDMSQVRHKSIAAIRRAKICCTLAVAVTRGVNDGELGDIVRFGIANIDTVRAINFQSATPFAGRYEVSSRERSYSLDELVAQIEAQCEMDEGGFVSDLFGHPQCNTMSLVYVVDGRLKPLFSHISPQTRHNFIGRNPRQILLDLFRGKEYFCRKYLISPRTWKFLAEAVDIFGTEHRLQSLLKARHILLFAKSFMDRPTLDPSRLNKCCYGIATDKGVYSFCAYNNLHRFA